MNKSSTREKNKSEQIKAGDWNSVLSDAEAALSATTKRARQIKSSIRSIKARMNAGEGVPDWLRNASCGDQPRNA
jgi:hypothetical protein